MFQVLPFLQCPLQVLVKSLSSHIQNPPGPSGSKMRQIQLIMLCGILQCQNLRLQYNINHSFSYFAQYSKGRNMPSQVVHHPLTSWCFWNRRSSSSCTKHTCLIPLHSPSSLKGLFVHPPITPSRFLLKEPAPDKRLFKYPILV